MSETTATVSAAASADAPLTNFTQCHAGIVRRLNALDELPALLEPAARPRARRSSSACARGQDSELDANDVHRLVSEYVAHARYEETDFLPAAEAILGRNDNHMAALGLSLHLRHAPQPVPYV